MFLLNIGYRWTNIERVDGIIINASGVHITQIERRNINIKPKVLLFDPQLYLAGLDSEHCNTTCARLSTYPWFGGSKFEYDSEILTQKEWFEKHRESMVWPISLPTAVNDIRECIKACFDIQINLGVTHLIIPTPIVENLEDEFATQLIWIDTALELKSEYDYPMLATVAFTDNIVLHQEPLDNKVVQTIIDNLSTREELDGAYVLPVQLGNNSIRIIQKRVASTLLYISYVLGEQNGKIVFINFADSFGYACLAVGATGFGGGYSNKTRRMNFIDFIDDAGGRAYPRFYSHNLILELLTERDLTKLRDARLLRLLKSDLTNSSENLLTALNEGRSANDVPEWRESLNNTTAATIHKIERLVKACDELSSIGSSSRVDHVLEWLQTAEANQLLLQSRFSTAPLEDDGRHIAVWARAFEEFLDNI
jgi:hypothetical protein